MQTGLSVSDDCVTEFSALRMKRAHRFLIYRVGDDKNSIVIDHIGARDATFDQFKELMPKDQGR